MICVLGGTLCGGLVLATAMLGPQAAFALGETSHIASSNRPGAFSLVQRRTAAAIYVDSTEWPGVLHAATNLSSDIQQVTGFAPKIVSTLHGKKQDIVLIGTIGHNAVIDRLVAEKRLNVTAVRGHWEMSVTTIVEHPMPGVDRALVIAGADKRGTIFGIYDISEQIGVSPWAWFADVPVPHQDELYVTAGTYIQPEPSVKYRGIFLNDEAPSLTNWTKEKFGGYNSKFYTHVFDLLLRLKANFLWPAMWNSAFAQDDALNPKLADEWGIVMSTSHEEPMMRAEKEWTRGNYGAWDYTTNAKAIDDFWTAGLERNKNYEQVITLGMRGANDTAMSAATNTQLLEKIVADQRRIIGHTVNPDLSKVPQVWCLYKEVQSYYEQGMRVPDDVTLLWSDDNWGDIRRLPTAEERKRSGGAGIYYHFDYVGGPRSYKWLNTNYLPKIWEQMHLAKEYGADRIWVVNVGDLKPMEFPIEFFLSLARTPDRWGKDHLQEFTDLWAAREFGAEHAGDIGRVLTEYTKYNARRKPELIDPSSFPNQAEAESMVADYRDTVARAEAINKQLPEQYRDAYFQLVLYPAEASENVLEMNVLAAKNHLYAAQGRASTNDVAEQVHSLFAKDAELTREFHTIHDGKWNHMMDQTHIGYTFWNEPVANVMPAVSEVIPVKEARMGVAGGSGGPRGGFGLAFDTYTRKPQVVSVYNIGTTPFTFTATASAPWIRLSAQQGTVAKDSEVQVDIDWASLPAGDQNGSIVISQNGGESRTLRVNVFHPAAPARDAVKGFVESGGVVSMEAEHFSGKTSSGAAQWELLPGYGETLSAMTILPVLADSATTPTTCLNYEVFLFGAGKENLEAVLAPTMPYVPGRGLRYSIALDAQTPVIVDAWASNTLKDWEQAVSDGVHKVDTPVVIDKPGSHTLHFCMVDPGVVVEKLVLSRGRQAPAYLGPPESFHH
jgi:hypothetical protein